ncbi:CoA transferase subunit A [Cytobacillus sp. S13-E01]|uniref:CoA transferase subunit A n=1 Tax=Cytobacillus sp. S13-E01 TaxID=3031326 RepID=UPI0023D8C058|nr:CoA transferase subunit A [Cytobacillus sp. S13-E01]MDF0725689.1 CoA transferase subunit A [Cytobacillus sp. S13-E01]
MIKDEFNKIASLEEALSYIKSGSTLMFGGFGGIGTPPSLVDGILEKGINELTIIGNDTGFPNIGIGRLVRERRIKRIIASHIGSNPIAGQLMTAGEIDVEFVPQGTLAERIRAGGVGLGGILVDVGMDNEIVSKNKQRVTVDGAEFLLEKPLAADVSIIFAKKSDPFGNLVYDKSARNMNPLIAMAGKFTIAEVEEIVPLGSLEPEEIITPGVYVDLIVKSNGVNWQWVWE